MTAITGLVYWDGRPVTAELLQPPIDAMVQYGGDGQGVWIEGAVGFGNHLSCYTPESKHERLPFQRGPLTITADARIDNREELCDTLSIPRDERATMSDSALILHAYEKWGTDCAQRLIGDFAFAIWDARQQHLYCARDHVGARPFYYYRAGNVFAFATDLDALFAFADVKVAINEDQVATSIFMRGPGLFYDPEYTFFQNIYRVPFSYQITVTAHGITKSRHWSPPPGGSLRYPNRDDYIEHVLGILDEAVACRIRTELPIGSHISGGIDSTSVTVVAARRLRPQGRDLPVYSWSPPGGSNPNEDSEQYRIQLVCEQHGLECRYVPKTARTASGLYISFGQRMEIEQGVMRRAQQDGVRIMLSGWGGDELISFNARGYRADLFAKLQWIKLLKTFKWRPFRRSRIRAFLEGMWDDVALVYVPDSVYLRMGKTMAVKASGESYIDPAFAKRLNHHGKGEVKRYQVRGRYQNQLKLYEHGHMTARIEGWSMDGARYGLMYAYPLLDRRIVDFAFAIPDEMYLQRGTSRYLYRRAVADLFPQGLTRTPLKTEPAKIRHQRMLEHFVAERRGASDHAELLAGEIPWVDVPRLRAALERPLGELPRADRGAVARALTLARLWHTLQSKLPDDQ